MIQTIDQLPLSTRIPALRDAVLQSRAAKEQCATEEAGYLDHLARAEAEVTGHAAGSEGVELSGLITDNPYATATPAPSTAQGDAVDPMTGEGRGDPGTGGS